MFDEHFILFMLLIFRSNRILLLNRHDNFLNLTSILVEVDVESIHHLLVLFNHLFLLDGNQRINNVV